ncbi:ABC transporter permease [Rhodococcus gannanensis]|uniref:ABC transporter permease n=1 Tax=Rhodococcus gannanensis TaxID=1960308 RepID=A0ABW4P613_9NOCA
MSRAVWWASVVAALAITLWVGNSPMVDVSMSCSKSGELYLDDGRTSSFQCDDSITRVLGIWPLVGLGVLLTTPPLVAALAKRQWVSWLAVVLLVGLSVAGIVNWASYWRVLLFAVPLAAFGWTAIVVQQAGPRLERQRSGSDAGPAGPL